MWKNNRPKGWKNDYRRAADACSRLGNINDGVRANSEAIAYEAGADAILEELKKEGSSIKKGEAYCCPCQVCNTGEDCVATEDGVIVFIPD